MKYCSSYGWGTSACTCARAHRASVSRKRLDRLCSNLVCGSVVIYYVLSTSHRWGASARAHVRAHFPHLRNGWTHYAKIWCVAWDRLDIRVTQVSNGVPTSARAHMRTPFEYLETSTYMDCALSRPNRLGGRTKIECKSMNMQTFADHSRPSQHFVDMGDI